MTIWRWWNLPTPARFIPGRLNVQVTHQGFGAKLAPPVTRSARLRMTVVWPTLTHEDRQYVDALPEHLRGRESAIAVPWGFYQHRRGTISGAATPSVNGAHAAGVIQLAATGWTGTSPYLNAEDMVGFEQTIGTEQVLTVYRLRDAVTSGDTNLNIWPPLRHAAANGAAIYFMPSTVGGSDGRLQPSAQTQWLENTMELEGPDDVEVAAFPSRPPTSGVGHYGEGGQASFIDAVRTSYE